MLILPFSICYYSNWLPQINTNQLTISRFSWMWDEKCHCSMQRQKKICIWWSDHYGSRRLKTPPKCIGYWSMKILLEICTKAAIICLKKQNFKLKEISKNPRKNTQNSRKNPQNSRKKLNFWVMWKRCPKKTLDAFIHFHTLSYALEGFTCFHMLLYALISFYMNLYAFICFYILSNIFIYTFIRFYMLLYTFTPFRTL